MINIQNLCFSYKQNKVFWGIDLQFREGCIYGLLGENGVGKTTLLKIISGLLPLETGSCTVDEWTSFERRPEMLEELFFLPDTVVLPDNKTPIQYAAAIAPFYKNYSEDYLKTLLNELEVSPDWKLAQMSYGQQKKSLLAVSLSLRTRYLLLDEPSNGLDIPSKSQFRSILSRDINDQRTIIISTHQVRDIEMLIDPVVILTRNNVLLNNTLEEVSKRLFFEFSDSPNPLALYNERQPGGWLNVMENTNGQESQVNIEALFNTAHKNPHLFKELFGKTSQTV